MKTVDATTTLKNAALVSVVIPAYNAEKYIQRAIASVLNQTYKNIEIIVVDDGSTDQTVHLVRELDADIICITQENKGPASARNKGISQAQGEYLAFLDSDDQWLERKISAQVEYLESHEDFGIAFTNASWTNSAGQVESHFDIMHANIPMGATFEITFQELFKKNLISTSTVMVRKAELERSGGFDDNLKLAEDLDLWLRLVASTRCVGFTEVLTNRFYTSQNISGDPIALCNSVIDVINRFQKRHPRLIEATRVDVQRKLAELYVVSGYHLLERFRTREARSYFLKSLKCKWSLKCIKNVLLSCLGESQLKRLRRLKGS